MAAPRLRSDVELRLLHADAHLLVVDKPSGLLSVPAKPPGSQDCVEARLRARHPEALLVHRLDLETSGVMVFARTRMAQRHLGLQFERRQARKAYVARVHGEMPEPVGLVDLPLACDWPNRPRQMVSCAGRAAVTEWEVIAAEPGLSRLRLWPQTGRSHQLRVHLAAIGHPILGDPLYGPEPEPALRMQLHAESLAVRHPDGGAWAEFRVEAPF